MTNSWFDPSRNAPVIAGIISQSVTAAGTANSDIFDMAYYDTVYVVVNMGDYAGGNNGSLALSVQASNDGTSFTSPVTITGKSLTTATFTGSTGDSKFATIAVRKDEFNVSGTDYRYGRVTLTPTNQNLTIGVVVLGFNRRHGPGSDYDLASVAEIID